MSGNAISSLPPDNFTTYPDLITLDLSDNLLPDVPILDIPQLTSLYVSTAKLKYFLCGLVNWCPFIVNNNVTLQDTGW